MAIYVVIGTKAQLIKMAPILKEMDKRGMEYTYIDTGQHSLTVSRFRELFGVRSPDVILYQNNKDVSGLLEALRWSAIVLVQAFLLTRKIFKQNGLCLTHGDALTGLYGALIAKIGRCEIAHIEAGERTHNWRRPFPEELIRRVVDRWSSLSFAMSDQAYQCLLNEGVGGEVVNTHTNSLFDAVQLALKQSVDLDLPFPYVLTSIHRFETLFSRERLEMLVVTLEKIATATDVIFGLHSPTRKYLEKYN